MTKNRQKVLSVLIGFTAEAAMKVSDDGNQELALAFANEALAMAQKNLPQEEKLLDKLRQLHSVITVKQTHSNISSLLDEVNRDIRKN